MDKKRFGKKINLVRKEQKITAEKLAELCGVEPSHIRSIEGGRRLPSLPLFEKICKTLNISPNYLLECNFFENNTENTLEELNYCTKSELDIIQHLLHSYLEYQKKESYKESPVNY